MKEPASFDPAEAAEHLEHCHKRLMYTDHRITVRLLGQACQRIRELDAECQDLARMCRRAGMDLAKYRKALEHYANMTYRDVLKDPPHLTDHPLGDVARAALGGEE